MAQDPADKKAKKKEKRPTAVKRNIQSEKRRLQNKTFKASVKTAIRRFDEHLEKGDAAQAAESLNAVYSLMDKGVKTNKFKLNKASRTKARLAVRAQTLQAAK